VKSDDTENHQLGDSEAMTGSNIQILNIDITGLFESKIKNIKIENCCNFSMVPINQRFILAL
jgi:hypothetical protein